MTYQALKALAMQTSSAAVSDAIASTGSTYQWYMQGVYCQTPGRPLFGEAVTLRSLPVRPGLMAEVMQQAGGDRTRWPWAQAVERCGEGKLLVIDASGYHDAVVGGSTGYARLARLGAEGLVTDGALRDRSDMTQLGFGLFCAGWSPKHGTGAKLFGYEVNRPIACAGALVYPGDYLIGDEDGVVVIPRDQVEEILTIAVRVEALDKLAGKMAAEENVNPAKYYPHTPAVEKRFDEEQVKEAAFAL